MPSLPISRGPRTVLVGIGLVAVYLAYARLTSPWLTVERKTTSLPKASAPAEKSQIFAEEARKWFREDPWIQGANARFRDGGRLLWFNKQQLQNDNRSIAISPVAFLWQQNDEGIPVTATADSAQLDSSGKFDFQETGGGFGKIVSGLLSGDVRINGPDGLRIEGRMFHISEDAMKIWTSQPVKFAWGTHSGRAESGAEIELLASAESSKAGLMAVNDVQRIRLRGRIDCNLMFSDDESQREPVQLKVSAANGFEFFVPTKEATFSGFMDREANIDNQVLVERPTAAGDLDRLYCSKLVLQFQPKIQNADSGKPSRQLELARIVAEGQPVEFWSLKAGEEQVYANMGLLKFHLEERMLELTEQVLASNGRRFPVEVFQRGTRLSTGHVLVAMDENNEVHTVECRGAGKIGPSNRGEKPADTQMIGAAWKESLLLRRGEEQRITLKGEARVIQASLKDTGKLKADLSLAADVIDMFLEKAAQAKSLSGVDGKQSGDAANPLTEGMDMSKIRPEQLIATGNVSMTADQLSGTAREKLIVDFQHGRQPTSVVGVSESGSEKAGVVKPASKSSEKPTAGLSGKTAVLADTIEARIWLADKEAPQFEDVWLKGAVAVTHKATGDDKACVDDQSFTANGNVLFAKGGFRGNTEISLFGDPATVVNSSRLIEGPRIDLTELTAASKDVQREAKVDGSGRIRFVSTTGLDGRPLAKPSPVDIYWGEHMSFTGRTAHFVGNVRAVMNNELDHDVELTCAGLKVHFTDDLAMESVGKPDEFQLTQTSGTKSLVGNIERIECQSRVVVDIDMMEDGVVKAHHHAEFADLEFNQITGEFHATGPGLIESAQPDKGKRKLAVSNRTVVRANTPSKTSEPGFFFIRADFIGELRGNRDKKIVSLKQHIRGIFGPVQRLTDRLDIDGMSSEELPEDTGALKCENLAISVIQGQPADQQSFSMVAESNSAGGNGGTKIPCRFESRLFSGIADKIIYDHSKQQFILRADEGRQATVSHHQDGGQRQVLNGGQFEYYSDRNYLRANQITGVQSTGDLSLD